VGGLNGAALAKRKAYNGGAALGGDPLPERLCLFLLFPTMGIVGNYCVRYTTRKN
jgi:hypothetical protein